MNRACELNEVNFPGYAIWDIRNIENYMLAETGNVNKAYFIFRNKLLAFSA